jgi:hypothetical protein
MWPAPTAVIASSSDQNAVNSTGHAPAAPAIRVVNGGMNRRNTPAPNRYAARMANEDHTAPPSARPPNAPATTDTAIVHAASPTRDPPGRTAGSSSAAYASI